MAIGRRRLSRRGFLLAGAGTAAVGAAGVLGGVEAGLLPGRLRLQGALDQGKVEGAVPTDRPVPVRTTRFHSSRRGREVTWLLAAPRGSPARDLPVVVVLHGRGGDAHSAFTGLQLHRYLAQHVRLGRRPLAMVSVDGGNAYWHPRHNGDDPLAMVTDELLPRVGQLGFRTDRLGAMGWSMGGYGTLLLARESSRRRLGKVRVVAAAASSPALFASAAETAPGSFDGPADFRRFGRLATRPDVDGVALSVSCGTVDAFAEQTRIYRDNVHPRPGGGIGPGRHEMGYWRSLVGDQLRFLADHLAG